MSARSALLTGILVCSSVATTFAQNASKTLCKELTPSADYTMTQKQNGDTVFLTYTSSVSDTFPTKGKPYINTFRDSATLTLVDGRNGKPDGKLDKSDIEDFHYKQWFPDQQRKQFSHSQAMLKKLDVTFIRQDDEGADYDAKTDFDNPSPFLRHIFPNLQAKPE